MDYYILGQEELWPAIRHSLKQDIAQHTSVYVGEGRHIYKISNASFRRKPNGEEVRCCRQVAKYMGCDRRGETAKFKCKVAGHPGTRTFRVKVRPETAGSRVWGAKGGQRYIVVEM